MDIHKMLAELREERKQIGEAILTLERLAGARGHRRGRPPSSLKKVADSQLNIGQQQPSNGVGHTGERRGGGHPRGSEEQPPAPVNVGLHTIESLTEGKA